MAATASKCCTTYGLNFKKRKVFSDQIKQIDLFIKESNEIGAFQLRTFELFDMKYVNKTYVNITSLAGGMSTDQRLIRLTCHPTNVSADSDQLPVSSDQLVR